MSYSPEGLFIGEAFRNPGEEVTIIKFREAFGDRNSDHIILVSNGTNEGWVKPSNIQKNVAESNSTDSVYRKIRQSVNIAFAEFMDTIFLRMTDTERENFPVETYPVVNAMVSYALQRLIEFGEILAKTIARVYKESPYGERFIQDPAHTNMIANNIIYLDQDGNIVTIQNPEIALSASHPKYLVMKRYESYDV
jgi:hypothetical protein